MISYRTFRNSDPPRLAEIWRGTAPQQSFAQPLSTTQLEELVLAKPYFDRYGLIVATDDDVPIGFVHVGFGPADDLEELSKRQGVVAMLLVHAHENQQQIADELLARGEAFLREAGAERISAIGFGRLTPFYLGLYGGSGLPGVLQNDSALHDLFGRHGYQEEGRVCVMRRELAGFRPRVDRRQIQIRRSTSLTCVEDPPSDTWWEACMMESFEQTRFDLVPREGGPRIAWVQFWNMEPFARSWGVHAQGMTRIEVDASRRRAGYATYLLGEALRKLQSRHGITIVEAQVPEEDRATTGLLMRLDFQVNDYGIVLVKG